MGGEYDPEFSSTWEKTNQPDMKNKCKHCGHTFALRTCYSCDKVHEKTYARFSIGCLTYIYFCSKSCVSTWHKREGLLYGK